MDRNAHYNPFGPKSIISGQGLHNQNSPSNEYTIQEKWFFAVALGCIGGGMGYLLYRKKFRGPPPTQPAKPVASTKQPTRDKSVEFSCIQDLPAEVYYVLTHLSCNYKEISYVKVGIKRDS